MIKCDQKCRIIKDRSGYSPQYLTDDGKWRYLTYAWFETLEQAKDYIYRQTNESKKPEVVWES